MLKCFQPFSLSVFDFFKLPARSGLFMMTFLGKWQSWQLPSFAYKRSPPSWKIPLSADNGGSQAKWVPLFANKRELFSNKISPLFTYKGQFRLEFLQLFSYNEFFQAELLPCSRTAALLKLDKLLRFRAKRIFNWRCVTSSDRCEGTSLLRFPLLLLFEKHYQTG